ncbi:uncharacterized protein [Primulina eburnea]|uniref:uncharacterized protein n=1 Tax=Primulina eburnea TaxID=1245227 RepID=UPI003C6BEEB8
MGSGLGSPTITRSKSEALSSSGGKGKNKLGGISSDPELVILEGGEGPLSPDISFLAQPDGRGALGMVQHLVSSRDIGILHSAPDSLVEESIALGLMQTIAWVGEYTIRAHKARTEAQASARSMNDILARHGELTQRIRALKAEHDDELHGVRCELEGSQDRLKVAEQKIRDLEEAARKREEEDDVIWARKQAEFIQSSDFDRLCAGKAAVYFEEGFKGCLAQFRANGYSAADHPASFLDSSKALDAMPEEGELSQPEDQTEHVEATDPPSPLV